MFKTRKVKQGLRNENERFREKVIGQLNALDVLSEQYYTEQAVKEFKTALNIIDKKRDNSSIDSLKSSLFLYNTLSENIEAIIDNASVKLEMKYYDPLDGSLLTDPVELTINHPDKGEVKFKVNRKNYERYMTLGPKAFYKRNRQYPSNRRCYVSGGGYGSDGGFDFITFLILYEIFLAPHDGQFADEGWQGGEGEFGGAGATGEFSQAGESDSDDNKTAAADGSEKTESDSGSSGDDSDHPEPSEPSEPSDSVSSDSGGGDLGGGD